MLSRDNIYPIKMCTVLKFHFKVKWAYCSYIDSSFVKFKSLIYHFICSNYYKFWNITYFTGYHLHSIASLILLLFKVCTSFEPKRMAFRQSLSQLKKNIVQFSQVMINISIFLYDMWYIYTIRIRFEVVWPKSLFASNLKFTISTSLHLT